MRVTGQLAVVLDRLGSRSNGNTLGIITYHRIVAHSRGTRQPTSNVAPARFREQLTGLLSRGFHFLSLRSLLLAREKCTQLPARTAVLTFDDGFQSVYANAWPVLRELQIPATIFVSTAYLDSEAPFPFDHWGIANRDRVPPVAYRPLTTPQCREMAADGLVELGVHTHTHRDFRRDVDGFRDDLQTSVDVAQSRFGMRDLTFAFPWGSPHLGFAGGRLAAAAKETGVLCGLTTECVPVDILSDPFQWGRFNVFSWDTSATIAAKLAGRYSWAPKLRQRLARTVCAPHSDDTRQTDSQKATTEANGGLTSEAAADWSASAEEIASR